MAKYYRKQLFENGQLLSTIYVDKNGVELQDFTPQQSDKISPTPPPFLPDWGAFNRGILLSQLVAAILITTSNQYQVANLRSLVSPAGYAGGLAETDYPVLQFIWGAIIDGLPQAPTEEAIAELNAIALEANMIFSFDQDCKIEIAS